MKKLGNNFVNSEIIDDDETICIVSYYNYDINWDKAGVIQELDKGVEPNGVDYDRRTALHLAACEGWIEVVDLLLEKGADVNSLDHWGRTPLSDTHSFRHNEVCKILEARGGIDPVGMDSQAPCFEIDHSEVDMEEATRIGEWTLRGLSIGEYPYNLVVTCVFRTRS
ncbi:hypothetical protein [Gossypium barbadense]|uniref:Uncharacterized protein n=1 Tax=Gossypium barbadense TaxID=3634 RepID=A0A5J5NEG9_GOSBA|nr:hypothetical protein [Gossypium barbadense]